MSTVADTAAEHQPRTKERTVAFISFQAEDDLIEMLDEQAKKMGNCSRAAVVRAAIAFFLKAKSAKSENMNDNDDKPADKEV